MNKTVGICGITGARETFYVALGILVALLFVPAAHNGYIENLFRGILMFATMALGWNIIGGYTGYVSFGNVVFFGIGAYTSAVLANHGQLNVFVAIVPAMLLAAGFAVLFGLPILRLKGHYFGIATLGLGLATAEIIANIDALGGATGLTLRQSSNFSIYYYAMWLVCALSLVATWLIARSKLGYAFVAIRENEDAAASLGIDPARYKVTAWAISAAMAAAAGSVFAYSNGFIDPSTAFAVDNNVFPIVMAILGGAGTAAGPVAGAFILSGINETLWSHFPKIHTLFFGAMIVLVVLFLPRGLMFFLNFRNGTRFSARTLLTTLRTYRI